jgi:hypothetical protein
MDRHMAALRQLIYKQLELAEKDKSKGHNLEQTLKRLATLNDLMANYQTLRRRISPAGWIRLAGDPPAVVAIWSLAFLNVFGCNCAHVVCLSWLWSSPIQTPGPQGVESNIS